ncbi:MAG: NAD(P)H-hydrate dehydratase [Raoultibacter sp.]
MIPYSAEKLLSLLPIPAADAHKYSRGRLVLVAGSTAYPGAVCLASLAGQRMGAGYLEVVTDEAIMGHVRAFRSSFVVRSEIDWLKDEPVSSVFGRPCGYVVGSGFYPREDRCEKLTFRVLGFANAPVVVDGGALDALATKKGRRLCEHRFIKGMPTIITPHAGEAARLAAPFGFPTDDAPVLATMLSLAYGVLVVLKGPMTWIADGEECYCMSEGTAALSKAGTGDVLAGMIGSLLAQGLDPFDACVLGTTLHARAATIASRMLTMIAVSAEDVISFLPQAMIEMGA